MILFFEIFALILCMTGVILEITSYSYVKMIVGLVLVLVADIILLAVNVYTDNIFTAVFVVFCAGACTMALYCQILNHWEEKEFDE